MSGLINFKELCQDVTPQICSKELAAAFAPIFIIAGIVFFLFIVIRWKNFLKTVKKAATKKVFWVSIVLIDVLQLVFLVSLYFMLPFLIRAFGVI